MSNVSKRSREFRIASLFGKRVVPRKLVAFKTHKDILDAVEARQKALLAESVSLDGLNEVAFSDLVADATRRGLAVVLQEALPSIGAAPRSLQLYCLHTDQMWRIPARTALYQAAIEGDEWGPVAVSLESALLGYTKQQRQEWLAWLRHSNVTFRGITVYSLLSRKEKMRVESLGRRCFGSADDIVGFQLFYDRLRRPVGEDAIRRLPGGTTLARVALDDQVFTSLFGIVSDWGSDEILRSVISRDNARNFVAGIQSSVQFLTRKGWK